MRNRAVVLFTLMVLIQILGCFSDTRYQLVIGESCYAPRMPPAMSGWGENIAYHMEPGEQLKYQGSYAKEPSAQEGMVRQFDRRKGWSYVTLDEPLPLEPGTLVEVQGTIVPSMGQFQGATRGAIGNRLQVDKHRVICDTRPLQKQAQKEYHRIRQELQEKISLPGSRLQLLEDPAWRVDWLLGEKIIVLAAHSYDLMYAAEAQFLFNKEDQKLQAVYFYDWFKGE